MAIKTANIAAAKIVRLARPMVRFVNSQKRLHLTCRYVPIFRMLELTTPTPLASALSSLAFIVIVAIIYGFTSITRRGAAKADKPGMFEAVIAVLRRLDRSVVHLFSRFTGTRYRKKYIRMPMLLSYFLVLTAASVFLPWPFNMGFVGFGIFSIFVVFRHWSRDEDEAV